MDASQDQSSVTGLIDVINTTNNPHDPSRNVFSNVIFGDTPIHNNVETSLRMASAAIESMTYEQVFPSYQLQEMMETVTSLQKLLKQGDDLMHNLYCLRGYARAFPTKSTEQLSEHQKKEMYHSMFDILNPKMQKVLHLIRFHETMIRALSVHIQKITPIDQSKFNSVIPDILLQLFNDVLDQLVKLDRLNDMKSGTRHDFALFKRSFNHIKEDLNDQESIAEQIRLLQDFLSNPSLSNGVIHSHLVNEVQNIPRYEEVVTDLLQYCLVCLDKKYYLTPDSKFKLIRLLPTLLIILDKRPPTKETKVFINSLLKARKVKFEQILKILRQNPIVPLYRDMSIKTLQLLQGSTYADEQINSFAEKESECGEFLDFESNWRNMRIQYDCYIPRFTCTVSQTPDVNTHQADVTSDIVCSAQQTIVEGLRLLSDWSSTIQQQLSWKYQHPANPSSSVDRGENSGNPNEYEQVLKYNYSKDELSVLVDSISMIKSLANLMMKAESLVSPCIQHQIYCDIQVFSMHQLSPILQRCSKRDRPTFHAAQQIRSMVVDWSGHPNSAHDDFNVPKRKQSSSSSSSSSSNRMHTHTHVSSSSKSSSFSTSLTASTGCPRRFVGPRLGQLQLLRASLSALYHPRSESMQATGILGRRDIDREDVDQLESFYRRSFYFPYLQDLSGTVLSLTDLSDLWYREYFLEMTKCVQFPIEMSLPWMLIEHIIDNPSAIIASSFEVVVHLMDIYNDASTVSLQLMKQKYLFDEIEAEANLSFDQFVFLMSDQVYGYYKDVAACSFLDKPCKDFVSEMRGDECLSSRKRYYEELLSQRSIQILDKNVDLNELFCQHMNSKVAKDIEICMQRFEASDVTAVLEYQCLHEIIKATHLLLSKNLLLRSFEDLYHEVNETVSPLGSKGRFMTSLCGKLLSDLVTNFAYNAYTERYMRSPICLGDPVLKEPYPKNLPKFLVFGQQCKLAYDLIHKMNQGYFGVPHVSAIIDLLTQHEVAALVDKCVALLEEKVNGSLVLYMETLKKTIPPVKLPKFLYLTGGCYGYFEGKLKVLLNYPDLRIQIFQLFREIGNVLSLLNMLQSTILQKEHMLFNLTTSSFQRKSSGVSREDKGLALHNRIQAMKDLDDNTYSLVENVLSMMNLASSSPRGGLIVHNMLSRLQTTLTNIVNKAASGDTSFSDLGRFWSVLQFLYCTEIEQPQANQPRTIMDREEFGDGFLWAGCTLTYLLGQIHRSRSLDFSEHMMAVHAQEKSDKRLAENEAVGGSKELLGSLDDKLTGQAKGYLRNASFVAGTVSCIYSIIQNYYTVENQPSQYYPPKDDASFCKENVRHVLSTRNGKQFCDEFDQKVDENSAN